MGNAAGKLTPCLCTTSGDISARHEIPLVLANHPLDQGFGHSFCYIRPDHFGIQSTSATSSSCLITGPHQLTTTTITPFFRTISGASISANTSTPLSTTLYLDPYPNPNPIFIEKQSSSFESSSSFASVPLQPIPRSIVINSGPVPACASVSGSGSLLGSGLIERGFLSGPIERGFLSGPIDHRTLQVRMKSKYRFRKWGSFKDVKDSILGAIRRSGSKQMERDCNGNNESVGRSSYASGHVSGSLCGDETEEVGDVSNLQWAQGKAGEDRVHIVISEDHGWVFVGIYDGFNGPDATDFLLTHLYSAVHKELIGLMQLWNERWESESELSNQSTLSNDSSSSTQGNHLGEEVNDCLRRFSGLETDCSGRSFDHLYENGGEFDSNSITNMLENRNGSQKKNNKGQKLESNLDSDSNSDGNSKSRLIFELDEKIREKMNQMGSKYSSKLKHSEVMKALSEALRKTEEAYLDIADKMVNENPELCLMGSCVLVMLMMGQNIYLMNVGDSRAIVGQRSPDSSDLFDDFPNVSSLQLTMDHNTYVKEEVKRIRSEHLDDPSALINHRVKGSLKVTRAFGAGFLKQPKWNEALLESFRIDYIGSSPYITCRPSLHHYKVGSRDKFLILSSDGLYQYFTNEEVASDVEMFMASTPEGDPAQHLIEEVLFRAAKSAGMDFHELLEIPQGERRRYHDDVSVIVISLEGRIWRSSV